MEEELQRLIEDFLTQKQLFEVVRQRIGPEN